MSDAQGSVIVRTAGTEDLSIVADIESESFASPWPEEALSAELANPVSRIHLALWKGEPAGFLIAWTLPGEIQLQKIAVRPAFRRRHIARRLLDGLLANAKEGDRILLELRETNSAALALYRSFGFELDGVRRGYYADTGEHALLLGLTIHRKGARP